MKIFISYATEDTNEFRINDIVEFLERQKDIDHVYYWERDTKLGQSFMEYMKQKIKECNIIIDTGDINEYIFYLEKAYDEYKEISL